MTDLTDVTGVTGVPIVSLLSVPWDFDPAVLAACAAALLAYGAAYRSTRARALPFAAGVAVTFLALASPLGVLARGSLFSAHMVQHLVLLLVVPPLLLWSLPPRAASPRPARTPVVPWALGVGAMGLWHVPALCNAAAESLAVQRLQTLSLLGMGAAFWWPIFGPRAAARLEPLAGVVYLFAACIACTVLGVFLTFSPVEVCSAYARPVEALGISRAHDQAIGGLLMWVPACAIYAAAILAMIARHFRDDAVASGASERT